jgi:palmitoyltransferase
MEVIALMLIIYFMIGACICLLVCVNPNDPGFLGTLNRFFFRKFPAIFRYIYIYVAIS